LKWFNRAQKTSILAYVPNQHLGPHKSINQSINQLINQQNYEPWPRV